MVVYFDNRFPIDEALERIKKPTYDFSVSERLLAEEVLFDDPDFCGVIAEDGKNNSRNYVAIRNLKVDGKSCSGLIQFDMGIGIFYNGVFNKNAIQFMSKFIDEIKSNLAFYTPIKWKLKKEQNSKVYKGTQIPQTAEKIEAMVTLEKVPNSQLFRKVLSEIVLNPKFDSEYFI